MYLLLLLFCVLIGPLFTLQDFFPCPEVYTYMPFSQGSRLDHFLSRSAPSLILGLDFKLLLIWIHCFLNYTVYPFVFLFHISLCWFIFVIIFRAGSMRGKIYGFLNVWFISRVPNNFPLGFTGFLHCLLFQQCADKVSDSISLLFLWALPTHLRLLTLLLWKLCMKLQFSVIFFFCIYSILLYTHWIIFIWRQVIFCELENSFPIISL